MNDDAKQCAHPKCDCPVEEGRNFCSTACQNASSTAESCKCGHADCGARTEFSEGFAPRR